MPYEHTWDVDGVPVLHALISLPCPEEKAQRRIRHYYQLQSRAFVRYCESFLLPEAKASFAQALSESHPFQCWETELTCRITYQEGSLLSLYTQSREPGPLVIRRGDTWDLSEGAPVPLSRFFRRRGLWRRVFYHAACADLERRQRGGAADLREDWRRQLKRSLNPRDYYLTEEGLTFFLPMYALGGAQLGIPTFTVPWNEKNSPPFSKS
jgi:hypothetical protein